MGLKDIGITTLTFDVIDDVIIQSAIGHFLLARMHAIGLFLDRHRGLICVLFKM